MGARLEKFCRFLVGWPDPVGPDYEKARDSVKQLKGTAFLTQPTYMAEDVFIGEQGGPHVYPYLERSRRVHDLDTDTWQDEGL